MYIKITNHIIKIITNLENCFALILCKLEELLETNRHLPYIGKCLAPGMFSLRNLLGNDILQWYLFHIGLVWKQAEQVVC